MLDREPTPPQWKQAATKRRLPRKINLAIMLVVAGAAARTAPAGPPPGPASNDLCENAVLLTASPAPTPTLMAAATVEAATTDDLESCAFPVRRGLWFEVVGNGNELRVQLLFFHMQEMRVEVRCSSCDTLGCVTAGRFFSADAGLSWCSEPGITYQIHVGFATETLPVNPIYSVAVVDMMTPCTAPSGRCCLVDMAMCLDGLDQCECIGMGGVFDADATCVDACPIVPDNDDCVDATPIAGTGLFGFDTRLATTDGDTPLGCTVMQRDVWYCWTAPQDGVATVQTCGRTDVDTALEVYEGCGCPAGNALLACNRFFCDRQSRVVFPVQAGAAYLIRLGIGLAQVGGPGDLEIDIVPGPLGACCLPPTTCLELDEAGCLQLGGQLTPDTVCGNVQCLVEDMPVPNDDCATARAIDADSVTLGYTEFVEAGDPILSDPDRLCGIDPEEVDESVPPIGGLWYTVEGTGSLLTASLCRDGGFSNFEMAMLVFCGPCDDLTCIGGNIDGDECDTPEVSWCAEAGVVYRVFVVGLDDGGFFRLSIVDRAEPCTSEVTCFERRHPGWNWVDNEIMLTKNEPAYWSAATGAPKGVSPFSVLDPGDPPGRPDPDGSGDRVLRGSIVAWAIDASGAEIRWNHLKGDATIVDYAESSAFEYNASSFAVVAPAVPHGAATGTPGTLHLDGVEYAPAHDLLLVDFYAAGAMPFLTRPRPEIVADGELTLMPLSLDLRQETEGPLTVKATFSIWNQNEVKFSGTDRCITCWDQALLSRVELPNHFRREHLQTDKGRARVDGVASQLCDVDNDPKDGLAVGEGGNDVVSTAAALIGVRATLLDFGPGGKLVRAGTNLHGMGTESAVIRFDRLGAPPEATVPVRDADRRVSAGPLRVSSPASPRVASGGVSGVASVVDRVSASEKGSLLVYPRVELRWNARGELVRDTFVDISNDYPEDVRVLMYFVNGDPPLGKGERSKD